MKPKKVLFIVIGCAGTIFLLMHPAAQDLSMQGLDKYSIFKDYNKGGQQRTVRH